ncbi:MAG: nucleotide modification associated domain-containing protein [Bacillota bacterium]|nr:nucleotide modification associated domain-containing protein [Bacillota bacterium]
MSEASKPRTFEEALDSVIADARAVMIDRQRKYGSGNISAFGEIGVLVRASDKLERLKHFHLGGGADAPDESVDDTWIDLANYALIALLLRRGTWGLPLAAPGSGLGSGPRGVT